MGKGGGVFSIATRGRFGARSHWFDGLPVAQEDIGAQTHWTFTDHLGSPIVQTDNTGSVYWQADYDPEGKVYALRTNDAHQPLRRPGQESQELPASSGPNGASPLYYNGARWYRPDTGRYTQPDPLGLAGSHYGPYSYAENDPINRTDPSGLSVWLASHPVIVEKYGIKARIGVHAFLVLVPDCPADFGIAPGDYFTISGEPEFFGNGDVGHKGYLQSDPDVDKGQTLAQQPIQLFPRPGESDTDFIQRILDLDRNYRIYHNHEVPYATIPAMGGGYNSNSYIATLMKLLGYSAFMLDAFGWNYQFDPSEFGDRYGNMPPISRRACSPKIHPSRPFPYEKFNTGLIGSGSSGGGGWF